MLHLPLELAPDPEATLVIETRTRRWRERERREREAQKTLLETQETPLETHHADEDTGEGEKKRDAAKKNAGEKLVEAAGEKRKRADVSLSLNDTEAEEPGARGMDLDR